MRVGVVTDSGSCLDAPLPEGCLVVPLRVAVAAEERDEDLDWVGDALRRGAQVTTSRPSPERLAQAYADLAEQGYDAVVSVHLSGALSGTVESAQLAASSASVPVIVVDSQTVGPAVGVATLRAVAAAAGGASASEVAAVAHRSAAGSRTVFCVDSLDYLRRGGRVSGLQSWVGGVLAVKPLLEVRDGGIAPLARVRTRARAQAQLVAHAVGEGLTAGEVVVAHADAQDAADHLAALLRAGTAPDVLAPVRVTRLSAALSAHAGPGTLVVSVCPQSA